MKQQGRIRQVSVYYKNAMMTQTPWTPWGGGEKEYALTLYFYENGNWEERLHAGFHQYEDHRGLKRTIKNLVDVLIPELIEKRKYELSK